MSYSTILSKEISFLCLNVNITTNLYFRENGERKKVILYVHVNIYVFITRQYRNILDLYFKYEKLKMIICTNQQPLSFQNVQKAYLIINSTLVSERIIDEPQ